MNLGPAIARGSVNVTITLPGQVGRAHGSDKRLALHRQKAPRFRVCAGVWSTAALTSGPRSGPVWGAVVARLARSRHEQLVEEDPKTPATPESVAAEILRLVDLRVQVELTGRRETP